jgi:DNA-binding CsgD family transcriptional regulator
MSDRYNKLLNDGQLGIFLESFPGIVGIFNFDTLQYQHYSENVRHFFGYTAEDYMKGGLDFSFSKINTIHAEIITTSVFPVFLEHCAKYSNNGEIKDLRFSYEYIVNCKSGKTIWCMHHSTILEVDEHGHPLLELFIITDINETKKDDLINFIISKKGKLGIFETINTFSYQTKDFSLLSSRERQILKLLCGGNSTPEIAKILYLSEHTIKTHRKNIMQKMKVKNKMDIVKIAFEKGLL